MHDDKITDFTADDLPWLNLLMRGFPAVSHGFRAVIAVGQHLDFPVESTEQLAKAVDAGDYGYDGKTTIPVDQLPSMMPAYYFPITGEDDFIRKVADAAARHSAPDGPNMPSVTLREATAAAPDSKPPFESVEEVIKAARLRPREGATGLGGVSNLARRD